MFKQLTFLEIVFFLFVAIFKIILKLKLRKTDINPNFTLCQYLL